MIATALSALLSHWRRQPLQLATLIFGLALATGLWSAVQAINAEARASYAKAAAQLGTDGRPTLADPAGPVTLAQYVALRRAGWQVSPVLEGRTRLGNGWVTVMGIDFLSYPVLPVADRFDSAEAGSDATEVLIAPSRLLARPDTAALFRDAPDLPPVIETNNVPSGVVLTDIGVAERLLQRPDQISYLLILPDQPMGLLPLDRIVPDLVLSRPDSAADTARLTDSFHLNLTAFGLLSFAVGLFIVHGTIGLAFEQRRGMFRTLRALGLPANTLTWLVLAELFALALAAGLLGLLAGYLVAAALLPDVAATLRGLYGAQTTDSLVLRPIWFATGLGMAVLGTLLASAQGLWRLRAMPILAAPGVQSWSASKHGSMGYQTAAGLLLIMAGILAPWIGTGLIAGFAMLAGLMVGAALLLPPILSLLLRVAARRVQDPVTEWVWADMRTQLPGLSLALMALLLALAANIGVGTMVSSFRLTFTGWLDQRLAAELYVTAASDAQGEQIKIWLRDRSDAVLPIRAAETRIGERPAKVFGIIDHATYRDNWPLLVAEPDVWDRIAQGDAALINEQLARREGLWPGDTVTLAPGFQLHVAGVYSDYGNPLGQAIVSLDLLLSRFANVPNRQFGIRIDQARSAQLQTDLRAAFELPVSAVLDQASIKAASLRVFERTFVVTGALNLLTLGVASFAILTSLLTLWTARLPQLAPVWALGLTRARLARLELLRSLFLAILTTLVALPLGLVLAWVLLAIINVEAFGWRLPMQVFPVDWLRLGALAMLAAGIAAAIPARRLRTTPPADLLKVFANER